MKDLNMNIEELSNSFEKIPFEERLKRICEEFKEKKLVFSTSWGQEDQAIFHAIASQNLSIEVFTLDTGRLFQETYELMDLTQKKYQFPVKVYFPNTERIEKLVEEKGFNSFYESVENRKECCFIRKIEPLNRALQGADIWITGLRREQSENRQDITLFEKDESRGIIKMNPILDFSLEELENYLKEHKIPQNSLHKKRFKSIGCAPCTRAIQEGEDIRAGRWWWEQSKKECGLHS